MTPRFNKAQAAAAKIEERIRGGEWPPGTPLPGERALAEQYKVSYMTMRQAIKILADKKLLLREHGSGTYVKSAPRLQLGLLMGFPTEEIMLSPFVRRLIAQIRTLLARDDIELRTYIFFGDKDIEDEIQYPFFIDDIRNGRIKSLIAEPVIHKEALVKIHRDLIPVTILSATDYRLNTVFIDLEDMGRRSAEHLFKNGAESIAIVDSFSKFEVRGRRLLSRMDDAVLKAADKFGIARDKVRIFRHSGSSADQMLDEIFSGKFDAAIFDNDYLARKFLDMLHLSARSIHKIPTVVSTSNKGLQTFSGTTAPDAAYEIDPEEISAALISLALKSNDEKGRAPGRVRVKGKFMTGRGTTAADL